jgi:hypothetical protein
MDFGKYNFYLKEFNKYFISIILFFIYLFLIFFYKKKNCILRDNNKNQCLEKKAKIIAISYGNYLYQRQLLVNKKSALEIGKVDEYYSYGPNDIDKIFKEKNKEILSRKRGNGYWLWKPYFILKTLKEKCDEGDYLIYTDAGILYTNSVHLIINFLNKQNSEMWAIKMSYLEKSYTKRDAFILLGADIPFYTDTNQYNAAIQVYKKSKFTEKFLEEVLYYSQDKRIITDDPNTLGLKNYKEFIDNRHDQTILSILIKKYGLADSGMTNMEINKIKYQKNKMPYIFCHYRRKKFKNYNDIKEKCFNHFKDSKKIIKNIYLKKK